DRQAAADGQAEELTAHNDVVDEPRLADGRGEREQGGPFHALQLAAGLRIGHAHVVDPDPRLGFEHGPHGPAQGLRVALTGGAATAPTSTMVSKPAGYISKAAGANSRSQPAASSRRVSRSMSRG